MAACLAAASGCGDSAPKSEENGDGDSAGDGDSSGDGDGDSSGDGDSDNDAPSMGTYTVDGKETSCEVSTQDFSTDEYSVVCQNDDEGFVQVTFKNEASARVAGTFKITERDIFKHPDADTLDVSYMSFSGGSVDSRDDRDGSAVVTISGKHQVLTLTDVALENTDGTTTTKVSASIPF